MKSRLSMMVVAWVGLSCGTLFGPAVYADSDARVIFVNQVRLRANEIRALEMFYSTRLTGGYYWYDKKSGLWGLQGGPSTGQILAGLNLGGRLQAGASNGDTAVFINGREIHRQELQRLQALFGQVQPGRYWLNSQGVGGFEGGPAQFRISAATQRPGRDVGESWIRRTPGGTIGGSGDCFYYSHPNGSSVMSGC